MSRQGAALRGAALLGAALLGAALLLTGGGALALAGDAEAGVRAEPGHESWWPELEQDEEAGHGHAEDRSDGTAGHGEHDSQQPGHDDHAPTEPVDRPLPLVLGAFGLVNGGVMLAAGVIRHRERAARQARQAQRAQRRAIPAAGPKAGA